MTDQSDSFGSDASLSESAMMMPTTGSAQSLTESYDSSSSDDSGDGGSNDSDDSTLSLAIKLQGAILLCDQVAVATHLNAGADPNEILLPLPPPLVLATSMAARGCLPADAATPPKSARFRIVAMLLLKGADIEFRITGATVLLYAAASGSRRAVALLLAFGANASAQSIDGLSPLERAVSGGWRASAVLLVSAGACADSVEWGQMSHPTNAELVAAQANIVALGEHVRNEARELLWFAE